jgi:predicted  nucleic acid-binding Zn-ribbon protein
MKQATTQHEPLGARIRDIDGKLETLRPRLATLQEEIARLIEKENRNIRLFAESDGRHEKQKLDQLLIEVVEQRASLERECKGVAISMAELEASRAELYPEFERLTEEAQKAARRVEIEELRLRHQRDRAAELKADRALSEARERTNKSFFALRAELDQDIVNEQAAALGRQKEEWARTRAANRPHIN